MKSKILTAIVVVIGLVVLLLLGDKILGRKQKGAVVV